MVKFPCRSLSVVVLKNILGAIDLNHVSFIKLILKKKEYECIQYIFQNIQATLWKKQKQKTKRKILA